MNASLSDEAYQDHILPQVSRTFALTIPQLPAQLRTAVTNAYLLCRIADTIEDEPALGAADSYVFLQRFAAVVSGTADAAELARDLTRRLSERTLPAERELVGNMGRVVAVTGRLSAVQRVAIARCVQTMCAGMHQFQRAASLRGLARSSDLDEYCYYVAGVVGQMLTELFCSYSPEVCERHAALHQQAVSFAQGLQMTNILKDVWEDRARGVCWLPQEVFARYGVELERLPPGGGGARFDAAMRELVGVAHAHLRNALAFTLLIPAAETGIRRFCLWAVGMAVLTLRRIERTPGFAAGVQVKISHAAVAMVRTLSNVAVRNDWLLRRLFEQAARGLPLAAMAVEVPRAYPAPQGVAPAEAAAGIRHAPFESTAQRVEGRSGH